MAPTVFICGATGTQGGATARALLAAGSTIHALARTPSSPSAQALTALGVTLTSGDFDNQEALRSSLKGCQSIFLNFMPDFTDMSANLRQANLIMTLAKEAGVKHVVYTSGIGCEENQPFKSVVPGSMVDLILQSKRDIEKAVRSAGFQYWTILRPGNFMANYIDPFVKMMPDLSGQGIWTAALSETTILPMVDTVTIGTFSSAAILDPERFHEQVITYADEKISIGEMLQKLSTATGRQLKLRSMSEEEIEAQKASNPFVAGQLAMVEMAEHVNIEEVKSWDLPLTSIDEFIRREKKRVEETYN